MFTDFYQIKRNGITLQIDIVNEYDAVNNSAV